MAKVNINKPYSSITIEDILNLSGQRIAKLKREDLLKFTKRASDLSHRRERIYKKVTENKNIPQSHAYSTVYTADGKTKIPRIDQIISPDNLSELSIEELRYQISISKDFLNMKTSTVSGWEDVLNNFIQKLKEKTGVKVDKKDYKKFFDIYKKLDDEFNVETLNGKYEVWRDIAEYIQYRNYDSADDLAMEMIDRINRDTLSGEYEDSDDEEDDNGLWLGGR